MADDDLRDAFNQLKATDESLVPEFEPPTSAGNSRWHWRPGVIAAAAAVFLAGSVAIMLNHSTLNRKEEPGIIAVSASPFDEYSEAISSNLFVASLSEWESPTDFLLDFDTTLTEFK